uniref:Uncharacterized protein n=1 Tax=Arundo donax TaxID=35708 RepID=A0A0A9CXF1_ARUDO
MALYSTPPLLDVLQPRTRAEWLVTWQTNARWHHALIVTLSPVPLSLAKSCVSKLRRDWTSMTRVLHLVKTLMS